MVSHATVCMLILAVVTLSDAEPNNADWIDPSDMTIYQPNKTQWVDPNDLFRYNPVNKTMRYDWNPEPPKEPVPKVQSEHSTLNNPNKSGTSDIKNHTENKNTEYELKSHPSNECDCSNLQILNDSLIQCRKEVLVNTCGESSLTPEVQLGMKPICSFDDLLSYLSFFFNIGLSLVMVCINLPNLPVLPEQYLEPAQGADEEPLREQEELQEQIRELQRDNEALQRGLGDQRNRDRQIDDRSTQIQEMEIFHHPEADFKHEDLAHAPSPLASPSPNMAAFAASNMTAIDATSMTNIKDVGCRLPMQETEAIVSLHSDHFIAGILPQTQAAEEIQLCSQIESWFKICYQNDPNANRIKRSK